MTATEKFIRDAIIGGWKPKHVGYQRICIRNGETAVFNNCENDSNFYLWCEIELSGIMLDPLAWQAVGKGRGWVDKDYPNGQMRCISAKCSDRYCSYAGFRDPKYLMHGLIDALCEGKTIEDYLASIE